MFALKTEILLHAKHKKAYSPTQNILRKLNRMNQSIIILVCFSIWTEVVTNLEVSNALNLFLLLFSARNSDAPGEHAPPPEHARRRDTATRRSL